MFVLFMGNHPNKIINNRFLITQHNRFFAQSWKLAILKIFFMLNPNIAFIFVSQTAKPAKNAVKVAKKAILGPFWPPLPQRGVKSKYVI